MKFFSFKKIRNWKKKFFLNLLFVLFSNFKRSVVNIQLFTIFFYFFVMRKTLNSPRAYQKQISAPPRATQSLHGSPRGFWCSKTCSDRRRASPTRHHCTARRIERTLRKKAQGSLVPRHASEKMKNIFWLISY